MDRGLSIVYFTNEAESQVKAIHIIISIQKEKYPSSNDLKMGRKCGKNWRLYSQNFECVSSSPQLHIRYLFEKDNVNMATKKIRQNATRRKTKDEKK